MFLNSNTTLFPLCNTPSSRIRTQTCGHDIICPLSFENAMFHLFWDRKENRKQDLELERENLNEPPV